MDGRGQRTDDLGAEETRQEIIGPGTKQGMSPKTTKRRRENLSLHSNEENEVGPQTGTVRAAENTATREELPPLVISDGDDCQASQPLRTRKKQRRERPRRQSGSRSRSTIRRNAPNECRREN